MADNTQLPVPQTNGDVIAADDVGGVKFQRVKITVGGDGVDGGDISSSNPLPVSSYDGALEATQLSIDELTSTIRTLVQFMYAQMPRLDATGRAASTTILESGTVTTVSTVSNITSIAGYSPVHTMFDVPFALYNKIEVS